MLKRFKYFIPIYGNYLLLKRLRRLEKKLNAAGLGEVPLHQFYEHRLDLIYQAIIERLGARS